MAEKNNTKAEVAEKEVKVAETEKVEAETKVVKPAKPVKRLVTVRIPRDPVNKTDSVFVGINFKNYILKRGTTVQVPEEVAEVLFNAELAEDAADAYAKAQEEAFIQKTKELNNQ